MPPHTGMLRKMFATLNADQRPKVGDGKKQSVSSETPPVTPKPTSGV